MIRKEKELVSSMNHKLPILMVVCDKSLQKNLKTLCAECLDNLEQNLNNVMSFKKVVQLIEDNQKKKVEFAENTIMMNIDWIEELQKILNQMKACIIQQIDQLIANTEEWIKHLHQIT